MQVAIESQNLTVAYQGDPVLYQIDSHVLWGQSTAVIGPNGAGKSTYLKSLLQLIQPLAGEVKYFFNGKAHPYSAIKKQLAYVPQNASVDWDFPTTVLDVVVMGRYGLLGWIKRPSQADRLKAEQALEQMGMLDFADRQISQLSGGQRQRVFLARALAQEADIYLLDEPLAGVDIKTEGVIMSKLRQLAREGKAVVVVHHDLNTVKTYFDQVILLNKKLMAQGPVKETFTDEIIEKTYGKKLSGEDVVSHDD